MSLDDLRAALPGVDLRTDRPVLEVYARDESPFQVTPTAVALVREAEEVPACIAAAREHGLGVTARAGGSSTAGQCLGEGLVVDVSALTGIEPEDGAVWVGAGESLDSLNGALAGLGHAIGPDVTSSAWARVGGLIGTNACGSRSLRHGRVGDALLEADVALADGSRVTLSPGDEAPGVDLTAAWDGLAADLEEGWPKQHRSFGGYRLDAFARQHDAFSLMPGSEGTLCVVLRARLRTVPLPATRSLCRAEFGSLRAALDAAPGCAATGASAVELLDSHLTGAAPVLLVEYLDEAGGPEALRAELGDRTELLDPAEARTAWRLRGQALARLATGGMRPIAMFEDPAVAAERAGPFCDELLALLRRFRLEAVVYGHAAAGCLHVRPLADPSEPDLGSRLLAASEAVCDLVGEHGGAFTGEHGWGLSRSHLAERAMGPKLYERCRVIKSAWDPDNVLNPGRIVDAPQPGQWLQLH